METKLVLVILAVVLGLLLQHAAADFYFNRPYPNPKDKPELKLICTPGRTVIRVEESIKGIESGEFASDEFMKRRSEPRRSSDAAERCRVCVCSVDGLHENCSKRPVTSLNECLIMESINKRLKSGIPFEHVDNLAYRIRRVGGDDIDYQSQQKSVQRCIPFVSEYTDCSYENKCNPGCTKCTCSAKGMWMCQSIREDNCEHVSRPEQLDETDIDDNLFDAAIDNLEYELNPKKRVSSTSYVPEPSVKNDEPAYLLGYLIALSGQKH